MRGMSGGDDGIAKALFTGGSAAHGEYYAVPAGAKMGVQYVPLGAYSAMLAPHVRASSLTRRGFARSRRALSRCTSARPW